MYDNGLLERVASPVLIALSLIAALLPFIAPAIPVGTDLAKHVLVAKVLADYNNPLLKYREHYDLEIEPRSTMLGELALAGLVKYFDPFVAAKIYLALTIVRLFLRGCY